MKKILVLLLCVASAQFINAQGFSITVRMVTGSDDLRGGNNAYLSLNFTDGTSSEEVGLGGGFGQNSEITKQIKVSGSGDVNSIRSVTIRHDGSPRSGEPFDSYDNWDLQAISLMSDEGYINIYNSRNDYRKNRFVQRFTGQTRSITLFTQR